MGGESNKAALPYPVLAALVFDAYPYRNNYVAFRNDHF